MEYSEALNKIHSLGNFSLPPTLDRIKMVLEKLSNPQKNFKAIQIAGTNGKGSVAVMLSEILTEQGYKTGLFTSPFILDFRERIRINGEFIDKAALIRLTETVSSLSIELTEFEFITAIAFLYFSENSCDVAVIETGLGGRLDATNVLSNNIASVITKIGLDHTAILGETIEKITEEKCGIIKDGVTVTIPAQKADAFEIIKARAENLIIPDKKSLNIIKSDFSGNEFIYKGESYKTALSGKFQIENALVAIETIKNIPLNISIESIKKGLLNASHPARFESFLNGRILLDGAHNPDAAKALSKELYGLNNVIAIIGMMADKDVDSVLSKTLTFCSKVKVVEVSGLARSLGSKELALKAEKYCNNVVIEKDYASAIKNALNDKSCEKIIIFGSLYLAAAVRPILLELK